MKKIMFNDKYGLTNAVLAGKKTVTRRVMKVTKLRSLTNCLKGVKYECMVDEAGNNYEAPYYVGEIVAVAQNYETVFYDEHCALPVDDPHCNGPAFRNKMFVRADLMPHQIQITDIRAERLQEITDEDCLREGIFSDALECNFGIPNNKKTALEIVLGKNWREAFAALIDKISGRGTWDWNPFVWRIEFKRVK